jgi:hypothetical protein
MKLIFPLLTVLSQFSVRFTFTLMEDRNFSSTYEGCIMEISPLASEGAA